MKQNLNCSQGDDGKSFQEYGTTNQLACIRAIHGKNHITELTSKKIIERKERSTFWQSFFEAPKERDKYNLHSLAG